MRDVVARAFGLVPSTRDVVDGIDELVDRAFDRRLRLAVTGLRQSGKTVFVTALVHHLLDGCELPFLQAVHEGRYLGARLLPPRAGDPPPFPFEAMRDALAAGEPHWPEPTWRLSSLRLEIRFRPRGTIMRQLQPVQRLRLEIVDYPGEWLLDLPLLEKSYDDFAAEALHLLERPPRAAQADGFTSALAGVDASAPAEAETARRLGRAYADYLLRCQKHAGLSLLPPGRFTMPGDLLDDERLDFAPLPPGPAPSGSLRALMAKRYERYRSQVVRPFYRDHFSRFDRQLVLVDVIAALNRGAHCFADMQKALAAVLASFRYGPNGLLARLFRPRIDKLVFAATKADHVAGSQHANLRHLLERMVQEAGRAPRLEGVPAEVLALAALRATDSVRTDHHGQVLSCVRGVLEDERRETVLFPGEIPPDLPEPEDWMSGRFRFRDFAPRRLRIEGGGTPQHIRLDQALERLIGDRLA